MNRDLARFVFSAAIACALSVPVTRAADAPKEALVLKLPAHTLKGTPEDLPVGPNVEKVSDKPPTPLQIPKGCLNVAQGKPVTASTEPFWGNLNQLTDGKREPFDEDAVEFKKGLQWVQVDLGKSHEIHAVVMWHDHRYVQLFHAVVLQVSDDPTFKTGVTTLYNNDTENAAGLGVGTDREYFELEFGRAVAAKGVKARYVRGYTKGSNQSAMNCWQEIEVYALPADAK